MPGHAGSYLECPANCLRATRPLMSNSRMSPSSLPATKSFPSPLKLPPYAVSRKRVKLRMGSWEWGPYTWIWCRTLEYQHTTCNSNSADVGLILQENTSEFHKSRSYFNLFFCIVALFFMPISPQMHCNAYKHYTYLQLWLFIIIKGSHYCISVMFTAFLYLLWLIFVSKCQM